MQIVKTGNSLYRFYAGILRDLLTIITKQLYLELLTKEFEANVK